MTSIVARVYTENRLSIHNNWCETYLTPLPELRGISTKLYSYVLVTLREYRHLDLLYGLLKTRMDGWPQSKQQPSILSVWPSIRTGRCKTYKLCTLEARVWSPQLDLGAFAYYDQQGKVSAAFPSATMWRFSSPRWFWFSWRDCCPIFLVAILEHNPSCAAQLPQGARDIGTRRYLFCSNTLTSK